MHICCCHFCWVESMSSIAGSYVEYLDAASRSVKEHELLTICCYCRGKEETEKVGKDQINRVSSFHAKKLR